MPMRTDSPLLPWPKAQGLTIRARWLITMNSETTAKRGQLSLASTWLGLSIKTWPCAAGVALSQLQLLASPIDYFLYIWEGLLWALGGTKETRGECKAGWIHHSYCRLRAKGLCSLPRPRTPTEGGWSGEMVPSAAGSGGWTAAGWRPETDSPGRQGSFPSQQAWFPSKVC